VAESCRSRGSWVHLKAHAPVPALQLGRQACGSSNGREGVSVAQCRVRHSQEGSTDVIVRIEPRILAYGIETAHCEIKKSAQPVHVEWCESWLPVLLDRLILQGPSCSIFDRLKPQSALRKRFFYFISLGTKRGASADLKPLSICPDQYTTKSY